MKILLRIIRALFWAVGGILTGLFSLPLVIAGLQFTNGEYLPPGSTKKCIETVGDSVCALPRDELVGVTLILGGGLAIGLIILLALVFTKPRPRIDSV